jgi:predicted transcriptional regulator
MPLGIVKDADYEKELGQTTNISKEEVVSESPDEVEDSRIEGGNELQTPPIVTASVGRGKGNTEVPQSLRKLIGESSIEEGSAAANAIGQFLGISRSSVSAYSHGATSTATYNKPVTELADHLHKTRKKISKRAAGKLFKALNVIDEDKLNELSALEASTVAKNMSAVIKQMEPDVAHNHNTVNGPVITFYAPSLVREETFDVITVSE